MAKRLPIDTWPHGRATFLCPLCHGTGLNRAQAHAHTQSRAIVEDGAREAALRCGSCEGRGRMATGQQTAARRR